MPLPLLGCQCKESELGVEVKILEILKVGVEVGILEILGVKVES